MLTGETGAGKSILLDALGLALGARADSGLVRAGTDQASVIASFDPPPPGSALATLLAANDMAPEPGEPFIVRRTLKADGGSRAFLNDQPCSAALLRDVGALLVEIHGQHDERGLLNPRGHRAPARQLRRPRQPAPSRLPMPPSSLPGRSSPPPAPRWTAPPASATIIAHAAAELAAFAPETGEEEALAAQRADMQKGARLTDDLATLDALLGGSEGALARLRQAARRLDRIAAEHDDLANALAAFDRAVIEAGEAEDHLAKANEALSVDPTRLDAIETRLFDLRALARKHQVPADDLADLAAQMRDQLTRIDAGEAGLADLEATMTQARAAYETEAAALGAARSAAALRLDAAMPPSSPRSSSTVPASAPRSSRRTKPIGARMAAIASSSSSPPIPARRSRRSPRSPAAASFRASSSRSRSRSPSRARPAR